MVGLVLEVATRRNVACVHFLAALPDGSLGCLSLGLPTGSDAPSTIDLRLHRGRPGVPAESVVPLLQRFVRGHRDPQSPFVLGLEVGGDERCEQLLRVLAVVGQSGCDRVVVRWAPTASQAAAERGLAAIAAASPVADARALAFDFGPSPVVQVPPRELPQPQPAVRPTRVGPVERAPHEGTAERPAGAGGLYGGRAGRAQGWPTAEIAEANDAGRGFYERQLRADGSCAGPDGAPDVEAAALFALAQLGDGTTLTTGWSADLLSRGIGWLLGQQRADGSFAEPGPGSVRQQALVSYALVEAAGLSPNGALLRGSVEDGLARLFAARRPDGGFPDGTPGAPSDTISTTCCLMAIAAADFFSFPVPVRTRDLATWLDTVAEATGVHRLTATSPPGQPNATATAAALFARFFAGQDPKEVPVMKAAADWLLASADPADPWCCYWTTYALFQMGGRPWAEWGKRVGNAVVATQVKEGEDRGAWEPVAGCSRLTTSALRLLTLEAYYRYTRLVR
ncbi:MAG: terpene cyclase/mutase family protein [Planctomycetes bacterium]|nr:terpene cyclase/mutase family protein [Planctomycetota bacterium]